MNRTILTCLLLLGSLNFAFSQKCTDCRYLTDVFDAYTIDTVEFGEGVNADGNNQTLFMDIYQPVGDTMANRPVLIFAFGGGFIQGDRWEKHVTKTCKRYAKAGYVAVAIDYRIGIDFTQILNPSGEGLRVFFRPVQDMRAATQYMYYSADQLNNPYQIDTNKIFVGGASSGAITGLCMMYGDKVSEWEQISDTSAISALGGINATSANGPHAAYGWDAIGVINIAGALPNKDWIEPGGVPIISAHGDEDDTVPYEDQASLNLALQFVGITLEGSYLIDQEAQADGVCSYLYTMVGEDHPGNGKSDYYFENIYNRMMPRMKALIDGQTFCCNLDVTIDGDTLKQVATNGAALELNATITGGTGGETVKWCSFPCAESADQASVTFNPEPDNIDEGVQYYVATATEGNCAVTDFVAVEKGDSVVSTGQLIQPLQAQVYPNPVSQHFYIEWDRNQANFYLTNITGKTLINQTLVRGTNRLSASDLEPGIYLYRVVTINGAFASGTINVMR